MEDHKKAPAQRQGPASASRVSLRAIRLAPHNPLCHITQRERPERVPSGAVVTAKRIGYGLSHQRIRPHCPEENGLIERSNRTLREPLEEVELWDILEAEREMARIIRRYNEQRLHSALG